MNQSETRTLWISVGAALFAVFLLYSYTQEKAAEINKKFSAKKRVVVATRDINEMETIDESMLEIVERPVSFIEPKAVSDPEGAIGRVALAPLLKGEQVLESKVMEPGPVTGLSLQVAPSKRAVTVPVDEMRGVARLLKPGDRIDLVAALDVGRGVAQKRQVKTIMQDVVILATGLRVVNELPRLFEKVGKDDYIKNLRGDTKYASITIEASPKEAQDLIYILSTSPGSLFMTLRHPSDHTKKRIADSDIYSVLGRVSPTQLAKQVRVPAAKQTPPPKTLPRKRKRKGPFIDL